ncbi:hypothetical protein BBP40_008593 [Aspergillus hancockii]|nr:hypothetical protein BBP40_008593 [Aspergillus hancockii]
MLTVRFARNLYQLENRESAQEIHFLVGVSSSRLRVVAVDFLDEIEAPDRSEAYGSYSALLDEPGIDVVLIAAPPSHHFQNAMLALEAGSDAATPRSQLARVRIEGSDGKIKIFGWDLGLTRQDLFNKRVNPIEPCSKTSHQGGTEFILQMDEVACCVRAGLLESPDIPWKESLIVMEILDMLRQQHSPWFPPEVETSECPVNLPSKPSVATLAMR